MTKIAIAQMSSQDKLHQNMETIIKLVFFASKENSNLIVFPENMFYVGAPSNTLGVAKQIKQFDMIKTLAFAAKTFKIAVLIGSYPHFQNNKLTSRSLFINEKGKILNHYDKIHLFDVSFPKKHKESGTFKPGKTTQTFSWKGIRFGLGICYDLRFANHFYQMRKNGVHCIFIPSCFTYETGQAHWHTLVKARAIENQSFVIAPAQVGQHKPNRKTFGHSLCVDPWGKVLLDMKNRKGLGFVEIDTKEVSRLRKQFKMY